MRRVSQYEGAAMMSNRRPMTEPEFASFLQAHEERWELVDGAPIMVVRTTQRHRDIIANILAALHSQLRGTGYRPTCSRTGVRTGETTIRYPDLVVDCGPRVDQAMCATAPALVIEVLSPAHDPFDTHLRVLEYKTHTDIAFILQIDPDAPRIIMLQRDGAGWRDRLYAGPDQIVDISGGAAALVLRDVYDGCEFTQPDDTLRGRLC
jgi:Uma2 family endonuclease